MSRLNSPEWAIKAGLLEEDFQGWGERFFSTYQGANRPFLTWQPDRPLVSGKQEVYLYFLMNFSPLPTQVRLRAEITYFDKPAETITVDSLAGVQYCQIMGAPVGPAALGIQDASQVKSYKVWLANQDFMRFSEVRTYVIDHRYQAQERCLLFSNSFHVFDSLRLVGKGSESLKVSRSMASRERPQAAQLDFSEMYLIDRTGDRELTVSTGYFPTCGPEQLRYLNELLLAEEWYLVTEKGHQPLELMTDSILDIEASPGLMSRTFSFRYTAQQNNFSSLLVAPEQEARPVYWRGIGFQHLLDPNGLRTGNGRPVKLEKRYADDDTPFVPFIVKPNMPGDPDYIAAVPIPGIVKGSTPYPNVAISRMTSFVKNDCQVGYVGNAAPISIAAGKYGGENSGEADAKAEAEAKSLDTQEYANQYGSCVRGGPQYYTVAPPPAGFFSLRLIRPKGNSTGLAGGPGIETGDRSKPAHGNTWFLSDWAGKPGNYVYLNSPTDMIFPRNVNYYFNVSGWNMPLTFTMFINGGEVPAYKRTFTPEEFQNAPTASIVKITPFEGLVIPDKALIYVEVSQ
ncbi:hypothetical protein BWI97_07175 [Siphonobacter sp. BAB-5405]|uniref:DUF5977 domain-containing protein n=1 Tax=Siphonobacter sp. BAB-5405 TaxID=1864825 RepID=UPI000C80C452|nr:DUF5977 domain-containing protein [Siphonobacter sp. BAB-5405]PMD97404.1 hypothetical protein BWI97_07175 [Siphonobacter sp. BAB-5405]